MKKNNIKLSDNFIDNLASISAGYLSSESFDKLITLFETEISNKCFTSSSESNILRIISGMYDKISFLNDSIKYPHYIEILTAVAINSNYLSDILVRNPEYFYWIINPSNLKVKIDDDYAGKTVKETVNRYKSFQAKVNSLRTLKRKEILRIGLKDILGLSDLKVITEELSALARNIAAGLFQISYDEILNKYNIQKTGNKYCLISLGKLGGNELNYSSDIDLIILYDENSRINNREYYEILTDTVYLFIESAASLTEAGFIYRIDFRLRPDGRTSPLCRSINDYLIYYETRGEDWERQMLIKSDFVAGSRELYNYFEKYLTPFIYPSTFAVSPLEQIRKLKQNIEKGLKDEENIKLLPGGIRDIEFSVQALQLLNGGKFPSLRRSNTLESIEKLEELKLISSGEAEILRSSYIFFRRIEHYLQLMNDKQTHIIPQEGEILEKLSAFLGFKNSKSFLNKAREKRNSVLEVYNSILGIEYKPAKKDLPEINFINQKRAEKDLLYLREGKSLLGQKQFDKKSIDSFIKIEPFLYEYLQNAVNPDLVLQNFVRMLRNSTFPSIWYDEFKDKTFFKSFLDICQFSQKSIDLFAEDEDLIEYFLTRKVFLNLTNEHFEKFSAKKILFILSVQFSLGLLTHQEVSTILSRYFKKQISQIAEKNLSGKTGDANYFIAALGSAGNNEMTFSSDIDLIFVVDKIPVHVSSENYYDIQKIFQDLLLEFKKLFKPFDVDCRLRPEGKSSLLVWDINSYKNYLENRAQVWEFQAFTKINFTAGNKKIFNRFIKIINERLKKESKENIRREILEMRKKIYSQNLISINVFNLKKGRGGLADIEFILQYFILSSPDLFMKCKGEKLSKVISIIKKEKQNGKHLEELLNNFNFIKNFNFNLQVIFNTATSAISAEDEKLRILAHKMKFKSADDLIKIIKNILQINSSLFDKYLNG